MEETVVQKDPAAKPIGAPSPSVAAPQTPAASKVESEINPWQEGEADADTRIEQRWIVAVERRTPNPFGIVNRNVDHFWTWRQNLYRALPVVVLGRYVLLRRRLQLAVGLRFGAQLLHGTHHVGLLREKSVAEVRSPTYVLIQPRQDVGKGNQSLNTGIPILLLRLVHQILPLEVAMLLQPLLRFHYLNGVCTGSQNLAEQRVWVQRNWRHKILQLIGTQRLRLRVGLSRLQRWRLLSKRSSNQYYRQADCAG